MIAQQVPPSDFGKMASADDDWDTSENIEQPADPYNKFAAGAAAQTSEQAELTAPAPAPAEPIPVEEVSEPLKELSIEETAEIAEVVAVPTETSGAAAPSEAVPAKVELSVQNFEQEAALATAEAPKPVPAAAPSPIKSPAPKVAKPVGPASPAVDVDFLKEHHTGEAFTEKLSAEALQFFNDLCEKPFSEQAVSFLNAYWNEIGSQAEFIFSVAYPTMKYADMHAKGVQYIHLYEEGNDLDFNIGLYFYEKLCKKVLDDDEGKKWREDSRWAPSMPEMLTAIKRKIELREKVDVNFDGRVSFLEYLLYQYRAFANPADFTFRAMKFDEAEHPEITKARQALEEVNKAIKAYEAEKHRLQEKAKLPGVKGLQGTHELAILDASPVAEALNKSLITAEAAVRIAVRKFGGGKVPATGSTEPVSVKPTQGSIFWLQRDMEEKKKHYGKRAK